MRINAYAPKIVNVNSTAIIDAGARYGLSSSSTADQTSKLQDMADDLSAGNGGSRTIILPAGEFHVTDSIHFNTMGSITFWPTDDVQGHGGLNVRGQGVYGTKIVQETAGVSTFLCYQPDGTGVQTFGVEFSDFLLEGPGLTNTGTCGIQLGGVSAQSDIMFMTRLKNLLIRNFSSSIILDDCTNAFLEQVVCEGYNYGIEMGFNIDALTALQCGFGSQPIPANLTGSTTSGSPIVTSIDASKIVAGMQIVSDAFPQGTLVSSVDSATQITADQNATATTTAAIDMTQGVGISYGAGPFTPASGNSPGNGNSQAFINCWFMKNAHCIRFDSNADHNIKFDGCYYERSNRVATITPASGSTATFYLTLDNCHFSQVDTYQDYAIYEDISTAGAGTTVIRNCRSDGSSSVPWVRLDSPNSRLEWDNNLLNVASGSRIHVFDSNLAYNPSNFSRFMYGMYNDNKEIISAGVTGALTPKPTPVADCTLKVGPMTGNVTINDVQTSVENGMVEGQRVRFVFEEDGTAGHTVTWDTGDPGTSTYKFHTAWTDSTVTTDANKRSFVDFYYDGANFIQVSPANVWL